MSLASDVADEVRRARLKFRPILSLHEGYAVIAEELDEFWDIVKGKAEDRDLDQAYQQLVQIAATAMRTAYDLLLTSDEWIDEGPTS